MNTRFESECEICGNEVRNLIPWSDDEGRLYHDRCIVQKYHREWKLILKNDG